MSGSPSGRDLTALWGLTDPRLALWVDAAVGGLPGYRPVIDAPGRDLEAWMVGEVLTAGSPLLDAAEAGLVDVDIRAERGPLRTILAAVATGARTFSDIARVAGLPSGALSRPLAGLERAGLIVRIPDPLRSRRDLYDLADPHLRMWLAIIAPNRPALLAGHAQDVWDQLGATTWRAQVLGPRWEAVVRGHLAGASHQLGAVDTIGSTVVADRTRRTSHEVDVVATKGREVVALGEAKLRSLGRGDLERLLHLRQLVGSPSTRLVLASVAGVDPAVAAHPDVMAITPEDVYG